MITTVTVTITTDGGDKALVFDGERWSSSSELYPREVKLLAALSQLVRDFNEVERSVTARGVTAKPKRGVASKDVSHHGKENK